MYKYLLQILHFNPNTIIDFYLYLYITIYLIFYVKIPLIRQQPILWKKNFLTATKNNILRPIQKSKPFIFNSLPIINVNNGIDIVYLLNNQVMKNIFK